MSDINFEDRSNLNTQGGEFKRFQPESTSSSGMIVWLMKKGIVKSEDVGTYVLIAVSIFFFAMSALMFVVL